MDLLLRISLGAGWTCATSRQVSSGCCRRWRCCLAAQHGRGRSRSDQGLPVRGVCIARYVLDVGGEQLHLALNGPNHTPDNILIHSPKHNTLMLALGAWQRVRMPVRGACHGNYEGTGVARSRQSTARLSPRRTQTPWTRAVDEHGKILEAMHRRASRPTERPPTVRRVPWWETLIHRREAPRPAGLGDTGRDSLRSPNTSRASSLIRSRCGR